MCRCYHALDGGSGELHLTTPLPSNISEGTSFNIIFDQQASGTSPYLRINDTNFNLYCFGGRLRNSASWSVHVAYFINIMYRATIINFNGETDGNGKIIIEPVSGKIIEPSGSAFTCQSSESNAFICKQDGYLVVGLSTSPGDNDIGLFRLKLRRHGTTLAVDDISILCSPTQGGRASGYWIPVFAGDKIWYDYKSTNLAVTSTAYYTYIPRDA
jgi:hypothetical protein